jgi:hypothetical protein
MKKHVSSMDSNMSYKHFNNSSSSNCMGPKGMGESTNCMKTITMALKLENEKIEL